MTISITIAAEHIPDGHTVFKPGGTKPYTLKTSIRIFTKGAKGNEEITRAAGTVFLFGDGDINQIPDTTPLRLEFEGVDEAIEFLEGTKTEEEGD
jgi:hypothetical protein